MTKSNIYLFALLCCTVFLTVHSRFNRAVQVLDFFPVYENNVKIDEGCDVSGSINEMGLDSTVAESDITDRNADINVMIVNTILSQGDIEKLQYLATSGSFKSFSLMNCNVKSRNMVNLLSALLSGTSQAEQVALHHCNLDDQSFAAAAASFNNSNIILLDLSFSLLGPRCIRLLTAGLARLQSLQTLVLDGVHLSMEATRCAVHCIRRHPTIKHVSLSSCAMDDECMGSFSLALRSNKNLTHLDLSSNVISAEGMELLCKSLGSGSGIKLVSLDLSYNPIGEIGLTLLAKIMPKLPNLKYLMLKQVGGGPMSIKKLLTSLPHNSNLETLDLSGNALQVIKSESSGKYTKYAAKLNNLMNRVTIPSSLSKKYEDIGKNLFGAIGSIANTVTELSDSVTNGDGNGKSYGKGNGKGKGRRGVKMAKSTSSTKSKREGAQSQSKAKASSGKNYGEKSNLKSKGEDPNPIKLSSPLGSNSIKRSRSGSSSSSSKTPSKTKTETEAGHSNPNPYPDPTLSSSAGPKLSKSSKAVCKSLARVILTSKKLRQVDLLHTELTDTLLVQLVKAIKKEGKGEKGTAANPAAQSDASSAGIAGAGAVGTGFTSLGSPHSITSTVTVQIGLNEHLMGSKSYLEPIRAAGDCLVQFQL